MRRVRILDVARHSFLERGYGGSTMSDIAQSVGGSKATLWSYFPSKEALFAAVVEQATWQLQADLDSVLQSHLCPRATLEAWSRQLIAALNGPDAISLQRMIISESARFPQLGQIFYARGPKRVLEKVAQFLAAEMAAGRLLAVDPQAAAQQFIGMIQLPQMQRLWNLPSVPTIEEAFASAQRAVAAFLRAYAP
ncbi:TetR/AcrR family transcriptional regulator [Novosphingobium sp. BL-8H]|uniref:TetR/AcrR family transcriptional regulator n=1 Tax=Novosphingobium sp. BL-8H TaxID=3127640 RepID=UPI00375844DD